MLDIKYIGAKATGYALPPAMYKNNDLNLMLESLLPNEVNVKVTTILFKITINLNQ